MLLATGSADGTLVIWSILNNQGTHLYSLYYGLN